MTNAKGQMTKEIRMPNDEAMLFGIRHSFILSSFGIRHSSFPSALATYKPSIPASPCPR